MGGSDRAFLHICLLGVPSNGCLTTAGPEKATNDQSARNMLLTAGPITKAAMNKSGAITMIMRNMFRTRWRRGAGVESIKRLALISWYTTMIGAVTIRTKNTS